MKRTSRLKGGAEGTAGRRAAGQGRQKGSKCSGWNTVGTGQERRLMALLARKAGLGCVLGECVLKLGDF